MFLRTKMHVAFSKYILPFCFVKVDHSPVLKMPLSKNSFKALQKNLKTPQALSGLACLKLTKVQSHCLSIFSHTGITDYIITNEGKHIHLRLFWGKKCKSFTIIYFLIILSHS